MERIYKVFWKFPTQEASFKCTEVFVEYLTYRKEADKFDGFEVKCRVIDPQDERGNFVVKADGPLIIGSIQHHGLKVLV